MTRGVLCYVILVKSYKLKDAGVTGIDAHDVLDAAGISSNLFS